MNLVGAAEGMDGDNEACTDETWTYCIHQIAKEPERSGGIRI